MKQTINGKIYDTETAEEIGGWSNGLSLSDFSHYSETLYKTLKGAYFLYGQGGPMSKYAEHVKNESRGGSAIIPMTEVQALRWCEGRENQEVIDRHFRHLIQDA